MYQVRERRGALGLAPQSVRDQLSEMSPGERRKRDLCYLSTGGPVAAEFVHQRMGGGEFVVPIGTDQHEVLQIRPGQQILQQIERGRVEPLQVVEEKRQWMLRPGEDADEPVKHLLEAPLRVLWRKLEDRWLVSDDKLQLGDNVDHEPSVWAQRLQQGLAPTAQLRFVFAEQRPDEALKRLKERRIRDVALVLIELARGEEPAWRNKHPMQLIDDRGFPDAGISGDHHQLRRAALDDAIEGGQQGLDLARSPVQFLGNQ